MKIFQQALVNHTPEAGRMKKDSGIISMFHRTRWKRACCYADDKQVYKTISGLDLYLSPCLHNQQWCAQGGGAVAHPRGSIVEKRTLKCPPGSQNVCYSALLGAKTCAKVPSWEPKLALKCPLGSQNVRLSALLEAKTCAKVPSWEPKRALKCPPGSQNVRLSALPGAKTCALVTFWEPKLALKCPLGSQNLHFSALLESEHAL